MWCERITELEPSLYNITGRRTGKSCLLEKMKRPRPHLCEIQIGRESWFFEEPTEKALTVMYCEKTFLFSVCSVTYIVSRPLIMINCVLLYANAIRQLWLAGPA